LEYTIKASRTAFYMHMKAFANLFRLAMRLLLVLVVLCATLAPAGATDFDDLAGQTWIEVDSSNFRIVTDQPEDVARLMAIDLENLRYISSRVRGAQALAGPPLTILALGEGSFKKLGFPAIWGGAFNLNREGYVAIAKIDNYAHSADRTDMSRSTVLHEYHHFLLHYSAQTTAYPMWYDEGMSEYWSSLIIKDGMAWFGHPVKGSGREYWLVDFNGDAHFDTQSLFNATNMKFDNSRINNENLGRFYARSRYAIHYFNSSPELRQQLAHYLRLHNMGLSQDQAVRIAFKKTYAELDREMRIYSELHLAVRGFSIGKDGLDLPQVPLKIDKFDRAAAIAVLADVVARFPEAGKEVTKELVATDLKLHPDDPAANVRALAFHVVEDGATRLPALLARHPNDARLLTARADAFSLVASARRGTGVDGWELPLQEARDLYRRAIAANPSYPLPYHGLGQLNLILPASEPPQEGIACLDTAVIYDSSPANFRALATLYLRDKQLPLAVKSMRSAVAFGTRADRPLDALLFENLELLNDLARTATPTGGQLRFKSGAIYEGGLAGDKPHGKGKWSRPNGSWFEGDFVNGLPSGCGKLVSERGVSYEGDFSAGMAQGQGHIGFPAGSKLVSYEGSVAQARFSGRGVLVTKDGRLEGIFLNGKPNGEGIFAPSRNPAPIRGVWRLGNFVWPEAEGTQYTGDIGDDGRRSGSGWCRVASSGMVDLCRYKEGKQIAYDAAGGE
jgi:hypothetical protein